MENMEEKLKLAVRTCKAKRKELRGENSGGTCLPGKLALEICPDALEILAQNVKTILVAGTNGKTTTCRMISSMLEANGVPHFANREGANLLEGIATAFMLNCDDTGKMTSHVAVVECDELHFNRMIKFLRPAIVVITNLTRDQIYRLPEPDALVNIMLEGLWQLPEDSVICLNQDSDICNRIAESATHPVHYFGLAGNWVSVDGEKREIRAAMQGQGYKYDAAAACCVARVLDLFGERSFEAIWNTPSAFGRMEKIRVGDTEVTLELLKNQANFEEVQSYLESYKEKPSLIVATLDPAENWVQVLDFSRLKSLVHEDIFVVGEDTDADGVRQILGASSMNLEDVSDYILTCGREVFLLCQYGAMLAVRKELAQRGYVEPFWEN